jgi:hypothetical protein
MRIVKSAQLHSQAFIGQVNCGYTLPPSNKTLKGFKMDYVEGEGLYVSANDTLSLIPLSNIVYIAFERTKV